MCQGTGVCVVSISYGVVYGAAYLWLECCPRGCLGCPGHVCARSVRWSLGWYLPRGCPVCGFIVRGYALWCELVSLHLHWH